MLSDLKDKRYPRGLALRADKRQSVIERYSAVRVYYRTAGGNLEKEAFSRVTGDGGNQLKLPNFLRREQGHSRHIKA